MEVSPQVKKELNGTRFVPGLMVNGTFCPIGPACASQRMAIALSNKRFTAIEQFVAVCARNAPG